MEISTVNRENFTAVLFLPKGEFKTGLIELYLKDYVRKFEYGKIQECFTSRLS